MKDKLRKARASIKKVNTFINRLPKKASTSIDRLTDKQSVMKFVWFRFFDLINDAMFHMVEVMC